jgi:hypothetical protein
LAGQLRDAATTYTSVGCSTQSFVTSVDAPTLVVEVTAFQRADLDYLEIQPIAAD